MITGKEEEKAKVDMFYKCFNQDREITANHNTFEVYEYEEMYSLVSSFFSFWESPYIIFLKNHGSLWQLFQALANNLFHPVKMTPRSSPIKSVTILEKDRILHRLDYSLYDLYGSATYLFRWFNDLIFAHMSYWERPEIIALMAAVIYNHSNSSSDYQFLHDADYGFYQNMKVFMLFSPVAIFLVYKIILEVGYSAHLYYPLFLLNFIVVWMQAIIFQHIGLPFLLTASVIFINFIPAAILFYICRNKLLQNEVSFTWQNRLTAFLRSLWYSTILFYATSIAIIIFVIFANRLFVMSINQYYQCTNPINDTHCRQYKITFTPT